MKNFLEKATENRVSVNSFKFYVPAEVEQQDLNNSIENLNSGRSNPALHSGETIITPNHRVLLFHHVGEKSKGLIGNLCVTNFRLIFVAYDEDGSQEEEPLHQQNLLLGEHSVCLTNIESIYQLTADKKKRLFPDSALTGRVEGLQIVCKNMRVLTFNFDQSPIDHGKNVAQTLLHHAFPEKHHLLFAYDYRCEKSLPDKCKSDVVMFSERHDWEDELVRTCSKSASKWRLSSLNHTFQLSTSLPRWLIIPSSVLDCDLNSASGSFRCSRPPVWTWSSPNGAALIRMADLLPAITDRTQENKMLEHIRKCHPQIKAPSILELDKELPSVKNIFISYSKLRDLCTPESHRQFRQEDTRFYTSLDNTKWLRYVSSCLKVAVKAAREIQYGTTVVLQESDGRDTSAVVSSLVQLMLDSHARSQSGFESLIQKEWVALGHPFCKRLGHLRSNESEQSPVFLLFLDCVWQLINQFPSSFEFTETYLTTLWDSTHICVFDTFLFDCERDRYEACDRERCERPLPRRPVWNWKQQFSDNDIQLFINPLYKFSELRDIAYKELHGSRIKKSNYESYAVILPNYQTPIMEVWTQCYFRWLPLLSIKTGGLPQVDIIHRHLMKNIKSLLHTVKEFSKNSVENGVNNNSNNNNNKNCAKLSMLTLNQITEGESSNSETDFVSILFSKREVIDNFFPFTVDSTSSIANALVNSSNLSEFDSQSILNLTE